MAEKILIIGGVALGPKAACRCKRLMPDAEVTILDQGEYVSYGGCGLPYYVSGEVQNIDALRATNAGVVRDPAFFADMKDVKVLNNTRALSIDRAAKSVEALNLKTNEKQKLNYDKLVLATGASPRMPAVPGTDLEGVLSLTSMETGAAIRKMCEERKVNDVVIVGGGFIGLESAVALADDSGWALNVTIVEMMDQILPGVLSPALARMAQADMEAHNVKVHLGEKVTAIEGKDGKVAGVKTGKRDIPAQMVIFAAGFIPNGQLAKEAGLDTAPSGAVIVDEHMATSDKSIYAGGDCAAIKNIITGQTGYLPLGSLANRQGRVIGSNLAGLEETFPGYVGSWAVKLFKLTFCGTGLTAPGARKSGFADAIGVCIEQLDRAHFYPEHDMMSLELVVDNKNRRVYGVQGCCANGDAVKARVDAVAGVLQYAKPVIQDISNLEVSYAPPLASAMDCINTVANVADNVVSARFKAITGDEFMDLWHHRDQNNIFFIDMRPLKASEKVQAKYPDWHGIPLEQLAARVNEIPKDRPVAIICNSGLRAYEGLIYLKNHGYKDLMNSLGGMQAVTKMGLKP